MMGAAHRSGDRARGVFLFASRRLAVFGQIRFRSRSRWRLASTLKCAQFDIFLPWWDRCLLLRLIEVASLKRLV